MGRVIKLDNDVHFMRKELDTLQRKVKSFDVTTEYALADSDVIAPTTDNWSEDKPSYQTGKFIWVRNTLHTGYGDIILEPYNIGDGQEHILSLTMEYAVSNDAFTEPTGSWVANAPTLSEGQYLWTRTKIVTNFGTTTTSAIRMTGEKGITGDAISIKGDTGDEGKGYDFIYYTSEYDTAPTTPSRNVVRNEGVYEAWCDYPCSVTDKYKYTYMSMRTSDNGEWGNWSTPTLMSSIGEKGEDGEGYEIIFRQTTTNTPPTFNNGENLHTFTGTVNGKHFNDNDFVPTDWSDDSNGVNSTYRYEYASTRTKTNGLWSDFSSPKLWNTFSETVYTHIRFCSTDRPLDIGETTTSPTFNTKYIGIYTDKQEAETFSAYKWRKWLPMEGIDYDGRFLHIRYSNDEGTTFTDGDVGGSYMGICYSYTSTAPDNPEAYTWSRIRGSDGAGMEFAYYSSATEQTSLSAPTTVRTGTPQANNWYERPYGVTETVQYCYVSTKPSGGASWGTPVLWAKYGATGQQGGVGERGEDGIGLEQIFCRTDADGYIVDNTGTRLTINGAVRKLASYTNAQPHTWSAVTTDDYFDETKGWYDNPVGVTENCPYEYVAQRMKTVTNKTNPNQANYKVAVWGKFNKYSQWSNYSEDGVSITGTTVYYAQTEDYTNAPTSSSAWKEGTPQTYEAGKFYWVKQIIHYDNGSSDETAPICVSGVDGQGVHFVYYCGNVIPTKPTDSGSVVPNGSTDSDYDKWVEEPVSPTADDPYLFMSQSTDYNYQTGKWTNFSTPAQIGTYSTDGTTVKTEWRYLTKADTSTPSTSGSGWSTTPVAVTSAKPYCFITSRIVTGNSNGAWSTPVLWSRYANDGDRGTGIFTLTSYTESSASMTGNPDVKYKISKSTITNQIGSITLLVGDQLRTGYYIYPVLASDNTYYYLGEKSNIRGESGASIDSVVNYYLASANSSGVTHSTTGWTTDVNNSNAKLSASKPYLWNYEDTFDSDGVRVNRTNPVIIGKFGKEISSITEFYQVSSSDSSVPSSWVNSDSSSFVMPVNDNNNRFLWNYERINYSDGSYDETEKRIIGTYGEKGDKGDTGKSVNSLTHHYLASTKNIGVTISETGWTTVPSDSTAKISESKPYLWYYQTINYTNPTSTINTNPILIGTYGDKGDDGKSVSGVTPHYLASASYNNVTKNTTGWTTDPTNNNAKITADKPYLWVYETISYTNPTSTVDTTPHIVGGYGEKGDKGNKGDTGLTGVHGDAIPSDAVVDKLTDKDFSNTGLGSVSNSVPSDFIANTVDSATMDRTSARCVNSNYISSGSISVYRQGNIVTIHVNNVYLTSSFPKNTSTPTPVFDLPSWAKPNDIIYFPSVLDNSVLSVSNASTPQFRVRWLSDVANMSGTVTYIVDSETSKLPSTLSWLDYSPFVVEQGGMIRAKLLGNGSPLTGAIIYFRVNGLVYTRTTNSEGIASLNINLGSGQYTVHAWYDGGKYDNRGVYEGQTGDYAYAELVNALLFVNPVSSINITWGSDDNGYYAKFMSNKNYPIRYHKVSFNINNTGDFNVETDGDGKAYFRLTGLSGSVSVFASIPSSNRITYGASATKTYSL